MLFVQNRKQLKRVCGSVPVPLRVPVHPRPLRILPCRGCPSSGPLPCTHGPAGFPLLVPEGRQETKTLTCFPHSPVPGDVPVSGRRSRFPRRAGAVLCPLTVPGLGGVSGGSARTWYRSQPWDRATKHHCTASDATAERKKEAAHGSGTPAVLGGPCSAPGPETPLCSGVFWWCC